MEDQIIEQVSEEAEDNLQGEGTVEAPEETTVQQGLTESQIRAIMREERDLTTKQMAEETAKAFRAMQSMSDKKASQVRNMAEQQVEAMEQAGAQITPEMKANYVNMIVNRYRESLSDEAPEPAQVQPSKDAETDPAFDMAKATVQRTARKLGVSIDDAVSSELTRLWGNVSDPKSYQEFLDKSEAYLEGKAKSGKTPPQSRMPSIAGNGGTAKPTAEAYIREVMAHQGDRKAIQDIQNKYEKMGLDTSQVRFTQSRK